jgi:regulator of replication initiation timing
MRTKSWTAQRGIVLVAVMLAAAGCENKQTKEKLAQLTTVSAEKDSLLAMMAENTKLLSDISTELAKVREIRRPVGAVKASESPLASSVSYRDSIRNKIGDVVTRLNAAESRLSAAQRRIKGQGAFADSLKAQIAQAEQNVSDLKATLETQKQQMQELETQVTDLKGQNTQLTVQNTALTDTLHTAVTDANTVYYVIGTKDELKQKGIVQEEGGKFLFFGSKALVPGWNLDPTQFTKADRRELASIPLPKNDEWYKIVSRQNLQYLGDAATKDGKVKGEVKITEPSRFWANSPVLIIVEG